MYNKKITTLLASALALTSTVGAAAIPGFTFDKRYLARRDLKVGLGTRYGGDCHEEDCWQQGACSFVDYTLPSSIDGSTCVSQDIWDSGAQCGGCISVTYKGKTIIVMVTNKTGGDSNHLDMTPDTWAKLTNGYSGGGVDGIQWDFITCPIPQTDPLVIRMHGGASRWWLAATVENARLRTTSLEFSADEGATWLPTTRGDANMFVAGATVNTDVAWVRVTSEDNTQVLVKNVTLKSGKDTKATENYKAKSDRNSTTITTIPSSTTLPTSTNIPASTPTITPTSTPTSTPSSAPWPTSAPSGGSAPWPTSAPSGGSAPWPTGAPSGGSAPWPTGAPGGGSAPGGGNAPGGSNGGKGGSCPAKRHA